MPVSDTAAIIGLLEPAFPTASPALSNLAIPPIGLATPVARSS
jgi:hypothetical protein